MRGLEQARYQAQRSFRRRIAEKETQNPAIIAKVGNGAGTVVVSGRSGWIYVRLHGDDNQLTEAKLGIPLDTASLNDAWVRVKRASPRKASYYVVQEFITSSTGDPAPPMSAHPLDPDAGPHTGALTEDHVAFDDATGHDHQGAGDTGKKITAAKVVNVPAGGIVATDVQAAVAELDAEKAGIADDESISGDWNFNPGELGLPSGNAFPGAPNEGDIYYRSDEDKLYIYTTAWVEVGAGAGGGAGGIGLAGIFWHVDGAVAVATEVGEARLLPQAMTFTKSYIYCKTTGTAGSTIADINKNGVTIYTTQGNRPTLAWNDPDKKAVTLAPDVTDGAEGDIMTVDIDQTATGAGDLVIVLLFEIGLFDDTEGDPADLNIPEADGVSEYAARRDHAHRSQLDMGVAFPGAPAEGDLFYRTDLDTIYVYDGAAWVAIGGGGGAWTLIEDILLGAPAATIDFQNIPGTYKHLALMAMVRTDRNEPIDVVDLLFNNSVAANYNHAYHRGGQMHTVGHTYNATNIQVFHCPAATSPANTFGGGTIEVYDYANTSRAKSLRVGGGLFRQAAVSIYTFDCWGNWQITDAINRITLLPEVGTVFVAGSRATLYGIS